MSVSFTGLGNTVAELAIADHNVPVFDKTKFSMCLPPIQDIIKDKEVCIFNFFFLLKFRQILYFCKLCYMKV